MNDPIPALPTALISRLSRRDALRTYVPPALAVVGATSLNKNNFGTSGTVKGEKPKGGGGNPGGGNPGGGNPGGKKK
jgi:hypothetical protein